MIGYTEKLRVAILLFFMAFLGNMTLAQEGNEPEIRSTETTEAQVRANHRRQAQPGRRADQAAVERWMHRQSRSYSLLDKPKRAHAPTGYKIATSGEPSLEGIDLTSSSAGLLGLPSLSFSSVGMLMQGQAEGTLKPSCTVSLTQPNVILTAYHCVSNPHSGQHLWVFFPYEGLRKVDLNKIHPFCTETDVANTPDGCTAEYDDLVKLTLLRPFSFLVPDQLGVASSTAVGSSGNIVGFGYDNELPYDIGIKREAEIFMGSCETNCTGTGVISNPGQFLNRNLCFDFDRTNPSNAGVTPFDSGGPMYSTDDQKIIGVAHGSSFADCANSDLQEAKYIDLTDSFYRTWLQQEVFLESTNQSHYTELEAEDLKFLAPDGTNDYPFVLDRLATKLILTLNHEPGSKRYPNDLELKLDTDLTVKCECSRRGIVEVCTAENVEAGSYTFSVGWKENCGPGDYCNSEYEVAYQMTAVALYAAPAGETQVLESEQRD